MGDVGAAGNERRRRRRPAGIRTFGRGPRVWEEISSPIPRPVYHVISEKPGARARRCKSLESRLFPRKSSPNGRRFEPDGPCWALLLRGDVSPSTCYLLSLFARVPRGCAIVGVTLWCFVSCSHSRLERSNINLSLGTAVWKERAHFNRRVLENV